MIQRADNHDNDQLLSLQLFLWVYIGERIFLRVYINMEMEEEEYASRD